MIQQVRRYRAFCATLSKILSVRFSLEDCEQRVRNRLDQRGNAFLRLLKRAVFDNPKNPYRALLEDAGIGLEDVGRHVAREGLDATLAHLRDAGVYLTFEEYKGRQPVVRRGKRYPFSMADLLMPVSADSLINTTTGGSTGVPVSLPLSIDEAIEASAHVGLAFAHWGTPGMKMCFWPSNPLATTLSSALIRTILDRPLSAWFTPIPTGRGAATWKERALIQTAAWMYRRRGLRLPKPVRVPLEQAQRVAEWIAAQQPAKTWLNCTVSNGVRVCAAAKAHNLDVRGTRFGMTSEPLTEAKRAEIASAGGIPVAVYSAMDAGHMAYPCPHARCADDMHVCSDVVAIIARRRPHPVSEQLIDSFLITTLREDHALFLLNAEFDDFGVLETRACGCYLDKLGFKQHIHHVRSFAKLTTQGTTVPWGDIVQVIEHALPQRFGGASIDYQLVEEDLGRQTGLTLLISPRVGPLEPAAAAAAFLALAAHAAPHLKDAVRLWKDSGAVRVVRAEPRLTPRGKLMPIRILRSDGQPDPPA